MWDRIQSSILVPLLEVIGRLRADTAARLGAGLGLLAWHLGVRRRVVSANLARALGLSGTRRRAVARRSYATMGANFMEMWTIGHGGNGPEPGLRHLNPAWQAAVQRRWPGAVFLTLHLGNWDMAGHAVRRLAPRVLVYAKRQHAGAIDDLVNRQRRLAGLEVVLARDGERTSAVTVLRALRAGAPVGLLADQKPSSQEGVPSWFLGVPCLCHSGPAFFAARAGVPIVPAFCLRSGAGTSAMFVGRPFLLPPGADQAAVVQWGMDRLSAMIAAFPGQYFWHHRRFKQVVAGLPQRDAEPWRGQGLRLLA